MGLDKLKEIHRILEERTRNIKWSSYPDTAAYRIWEATTNMNGIEYRASHSVYYYSKDSAEMMAKQILIRVKKDLAGQLFDNKGN